MALYYTVIYCYNPKSNFKNILIREEWSRATNAVRQDVPIGRLKRINIRLNILNEIKRQPYSLSVAHIILYNLYSYLNSIIA